MAGKLPAVVALYDHGGSKYFGNEKLVAIEGEQPILAEPKQESYQDRSWATELARRGYMVLVPDEWSAPILRHPTDSREHIRAYNGFGWCCRTTDLRGHGTMRLRCLT